MREEEGNYSLFLLLFLFDFLAINLAKQGIKGFFQREKYEIIQVGRSTFHF